MQSSVLDKVTHSFRESITKKIKDLESKDVTFYSLVLGTLIDVIEKEDPNDTLIFEDVIKIVSLMQDIKQKYNAKMLSI